MHRPNSKRFYGWPIGVLVVLLAFVVFPAWGQSRSGTIIQNPSQFISNQPFCPGTPIGICNKTVWAPSTYMGGQETLYVPSPYQHDSFSVLCTSVNGQPGFIILDNANVTCAPLICAAADVQICGVSIPVPGGTVMDKNIEVEVRPGLLADPVNSGNPVFTAQCVDDGNGGSIYRVTDDSQVSCNLFPCAELDLELCGSSVHVQGGSKLGDVLNLNMPPPFAPEPFTIQCVGSNGTAPAYQITDHSAVTCRQQEGP